MDSEQVLNERRKIELRPQNPLDLQPEELEELAAAIRLALPDYDVRIVAREQQGYGVTWWEVLHITVPWADLLDAAAKAAAGAILTQAIKWARSRFKKWPKRPKYVAIHGPDGRILKSVRLKDAESEPEDSTAEDQH